MLLEKDLEPYFDNPHITLYPKQRELITRAINKMTFLIRSDPGTGKTVMGAFVLKVWLESGLLDKCLILTEPEVLEKYKNSLLDFIPSLQGKIGVMKSNDERDLFDKDYQVYICDYNQIKLCYFHRVGGEQVLKYTKDGRLKKVISYPNMLGIDERWGFISDEIHSLKNTSSVVHKIVKNNIKKCVCRLGTTATPIEKIEEFFGIFQILNPGAIGMGFPRFMEVIAKREHGRIMYYREKGVKRVREQIEPYMAGVTKQDIRPDMPKQNIQIVKSTFTSDFLKEYKDLLYDIKYDLRGNFSEKSTTQMIQPLLKFIKSVREDNPRFLSLRKVLSRFISREKVIVWEGSPDIIDDLSSYYTERGVQNLYIHGKSRNTKKDVRSDIIKEFDENPDIKILFVSFLTSAAAWEIPSRPDCKRIVYYTLPTSMIQFRQANDRLYRINSESDVYIYKILLAGSLDEWLHDLIEYKSRVEMGFMSQSDYKKIFHDSLQRYLNSSVIDLPT